MTRRSFLHAGQLAALAIFLDRALPRVARAQAASVTATTQVTLRLRSAPTTDSATLALVGAGTTLSVLGRSDASNWVLVGYKGMQGWLAAWYCTISGDLASVPVAGGQAGAAPVSAAPPASAGLSATALSGLRLRKGPGTGYVTLSIVPAGAALAVSGRSPDSTWLVAEYGGVRGWAAGWLLTVSGAVSGLPVVTGELSGVAAAPPAPSLNVPAVWGPAPQPPIVPRAAWGARVVSTGYIPQTPQRITIHMDGEYFETADPIARMQTLQSWSMDTRGWVDIPYHYVLDRAGTIYEGRPLTAQADTGTNYDPAGHIALTLMGDYNVQVPRPAQIDALVALASWLAATYHISPDLIKGHRDYAYTDCPGQYLYFDYVANGKIGQAVMARLEGSAP